MNAPLFSDVKNNKVSMIIMMVEMIIMMVMMVILMIMMKENSFLASQDAVEVMFVTFLLTESALALTLLM